MTGNGMRINGQKPQKSMTIDDYQPDDLSSLIKVYNDATRALNWEELSEAQRGVVLYDKPEDAEEFAHYLEGSVTLVARENGVVLGFVTMTCEGTDGFIPFFYVDPQFTGRGIGRRLQHTLEKRARERSVTTLSCHTSAYAKPIYEKLGFTDRGIDPWQVERDNGEIVVFNDHLMVKEL